MGIQISRTNRSRSSLRPQPQPPLARTISDPTPNSSTSTATTSSSSPDLKSYEAACRADSDLRSFDSTVQLRTSRAINSIAVGLDARALSLDSLSQVTECLLEMNQEVVRIILQNKRDVWKNPELSDLVDDYFDNSLLTLDFCTALDSCLKRAGHIESIINVALRKFQEEHYGAAEEGAERNYAKTLEELSNFRAAGDPFTEEFFRVFNSIYTRQISMFERLQAKKRKLDKKLKRLKAWRRVSNVIFIAAFASVLICSVVAAAVSAPPVVTALAAAAAVPLGSMGRWLNSLWKNYERNLRGQTELLSSMQIGSYIVLNDLDSIKRLVDRFQIVIEELLAKAEFAMRGEEAVVVAVEEIRQQVDSFTKTIQELRDRANKCTQETRMARTLILRRIINHPNTSNQDIGFFFEAMEIFSKMQDAGVQPDKTTCNIFTEICCRTGEIWAMVKILELMKETFLVLRNKKALETFKIAAQSDALLRQINRHFSAEYSNEGSDEDDAVLHNSEFDVENGPCIELQVGHKY